MENELVREVQDIYFEIDSYIRLRHAELKAAGASNAILNSMVDDLKRALKIFNKVNSKNAAEMRAQIIDIQNEVEFKYGSTKEIVDNFDDDIEEKEIDSVDHDAKEEEEETAVNATAHKCKPTLFRRIMTFIGGVAILGTAVHTGIAIKDSGVFHNLFNKNAKTETTEKTENDRSLVTGDKQEESKQEEETKQQEETKKEEETEEAKLVLGEYGTFFDVTDDEQVEARANYIYDNYYAPFIGQLTEQEQAYVTPERIANVIRVMNGELPLDAQGNKVMDANIVDDYGQMFTYLVGDLGSSPALDGRYVNIPAYMFTMDGTELQDFVKSYDQVFDKMTAGFNHAADQRLAGEEVTGGVEVREAIAELGHKYWNEWHMQGIYGDVNPYNFQSKDRLFAYLSSFARYGQYAFEYDMNAMQPVCIPVCINYETKEMNELTVSEIFVGIASGQWDTVIAKAAGIDQKPEPDSIAFTQDLLDELTWKYNNLQVKKLN